MMVSDKPETWTYTQKHNFNFKKLCFIGVKLRVYVVNNATLCLPYIFLLRYFECWFLNYRVRSSEPYLEVLFP